jgi:hypothetical protein
LDNHAVSIHEFSSFLLSFQFSNLSEHSYYFGILP